MQFILQNKEPLPTGLNSNRCRDSARANTVDDGWTSFIGLFLGCGKCQVVLSLNTTQAVTYFTCWLWMAVLWHIERMHHSQETAWYTTLCPSKEPQIANQLDCGSNRFWCYWRSLQLVNKMTGVYGTNGTPYGPTWVWEPWPTLFLIVVHINLASFGRNIDDCSLVCFPDR